MTIAQEDITRYIRTQFAGGYRINPEGEGVVRLTDKDGQTMRFTCNIFGDIMDADSKQIIAKSDLPHSLDRLSIYARPKNWENTISYFG